MTNAEYYLKDGIDIPKLWEKFSDYYYKNKNKESDVAKAFKLFFLEEVTPTLTEDEQVKEMVYTKERKREVLATGYYFGLLYYVLSLGTHPTAYVKIPKDNWLCTVENYVDIPIKCHGGITFRSDHLHIADNQEVEGEFIGWDYAHCTDYAPYYDEMFSKDTHKWTTKEILEEVREVCSQIVELGKKPHLTKDERVILRNINKEYSYIYRNKAGNIELHNGSRLVGTTHTYHSLEPFMHLFQFIKNGEEYSIEELLKGE